MCLKATNGCGPRVAQKDRGYPALARNPISSLPLIQLSHIPCVPGWAAPTFLWCGLRLRRLADFGDNEGVFALTAGEHDMVAGVAQVGVGFA